MTHKFSSDFRAHVVEHLQAFTVQPCFDAALRRAAVAIVVVKDEATDGAAILLTKRSANLRRHSGQWALPGGRLDDNEDAVSAALRELEEELGLRCEISHVLGCLDDYPTRSGYAVTPVVVWGGANPNLVLEANEVAAVYRVPITDMDRSDAVRKRYIQESERPVLSLYLQSLGQEIYAPTAAMIHQFCEVAVNGRGTRVSAYEQPLFAWR